MERQKAMVASMLDGSTILLDNKNLINRTLKRHVLHTDYGDESEFQRRLKQPWSLTKLYLSSEFNSDSAATRLVKP